MIIANHPDFRQFLAEYLLLLGQDYEISGIAGRVDEAIECLKATRPAIVLVEADLPGGCGLEIVRIAGLDSGAAVVIALGSTDAHEYRAAAIAAGADGYISKLNLVETLPGVLHAALLPRA